MPGVLIASDKQYHETLRTFFAAGQPAQCCANAGEADVPCAAALLKLW